MNRIAMIVLLIVTLFGLSSSQHEEAKLSLLKTFKSSLIGKVLDPRRASDENGQTEKGGFSIPFLNRQSNAQTQYNLFGFQDENKFQLFNKKVQPTIKPSQYVKFPRINSAIEKFKQQIMPQQSPVIPQSEAPKSLATKSVVLHQQLKQQLSPVIPQSLAPKSLAQQIVAAKYQQDQQLKTSPFIPQSEAPQYQQHQQLKQQLSPVIPQSAAPISLVPQVVAPQYQQHQQLKQQSVAPISLAPQVLAPQYQQHQQYEHLSPVIPQSAALINDAPQYQQHQQSNQQLSHVIPQSAAPQTVAQQYPQQQQYEHHEQYYFQTSPALPYF
ncbi:unnamed protein product [Diamesa tonsa]